VRIAVASDEPYPVHAAVVAALEKRGCEVVPMGSLKTGADGAWAEIAEEAARAVADGTVDEAVVCCWTGTGASMASNKVPGIRAALCVDAQTAAGARIWNHANVLCLSNRLLTADLAEEIVAAWLETDPGDKGTAGVANLAEVEARSARRHRQP
jgi:ribose 5-phosphate isomerase B